jgi:hypothetical protein
MLGSSGQDDTMKDNAILGSNHPGAAAREIDDDIAWPERGPGRAAEMAGRVASREDIHRHSRSSGFEELIRRFRPISRRHIGEISHLIDGQ